MTEEEQARQDLDRLVARWVMGGRKNVWKEDVQDWLINNGYAYLIPHGVE